eukprot:symbB.v1.2.023552.t1/scaffold2162.1/size87430/1
MVRDRGFYLGLMDIALLVSERAKDKTVMMLFYDDENRNQIISLHDVLKELWPSCPEMPVQKPAGGGFDKDTWFFISCNADWHRVADEHLNHWVPAWHSQQLGADYEVLKCQARHDLAKHALGILESMKGEDSNEFDLDAMMPSLLDQQGTIQRQQAFYEDMFRASLIPQMELASLWIEKSTDLLWQQWFDIFALYQELPDDVYSAAVARAKRCLATQSAGQGV